MKSIGIVTEYNPFHSGHCHQIDESRRRIGQDCAVVGVMSGNWVQRGEAAITDKWTRSRLAVEGGLDLVLELPTLWATASAEHFARGAVALLAATGVVDVLSFGSECGEIGLLTQTAQLLDSADYTQHLKTALTSGISFAKAREEAITALHPEAGACLAHPNNTLAVEYLRVLNALGNPMTAMTIQRVGVAHDGGVAAGYASASALRSAMREGAWDGVAPYVSSSALEILQRAPLANLQRSTAGVLARLRTMTSQQFAALPDGSEGLCNRLERAVATATSLEQVYDNAKTKRYAHARIRRMVLWAFLGLEEQMRPSAPQYIRVLAMNERGKGLLKEMKTRATLPVITKATKAKDENCAPLLALESRCTDLYGLCCDPIWPMGEEWRRTPAVVD